MSACDSAYGATRRAGGEARIVNLVLALLVGCRRLCSCYAKPGTEGRHGGTRGRRHTGGARRTAPLQITASSITALSTPRTTSPPMLGFGISCSCASRCAPFPCKRVPMPDMTCGWCVVTWAGLRSCGAGTAIQSRCVWVSKEEGEAECRQRCVCAWRCACEW